MGGVFGKHQSSSKGQHGKMSAQITDVDRAVLDLKNARDRLQRYRKQLERDDTRMLEQAKKAKESGLKERALGLMRLRKYKQTQLKSCEDQLLNVHQMVDTIDSKQNEAAVLEALKAGKDSLKKMHEETSVEDVLKLMDEVTEEIQVENEINEILQGVPTLDPADEDAVEAELAALVAEMNGATDQTIPSMPEVPVTPAMPSAPKKPIQEPAQQQKPERLAIPG